MRVSCCALSAVRWLVAGCCMLLLCVDGRCSLFVVRCVVFVVGGRCVLLVGCWLSGVCCLLFKGLLVFVVRWLSCAVVCWCVVLYAVVWRCCCRVLLCVVVGGRCSLFNVRCSLFVVCCSLVRVSCSLCVVCCVLFGV